MRTGANADANLADVLAKEYGSAVEPRVVQWGIDARGAAKRVSELTEQAVQRGTAKREFGYLQSELKGVADTGGTLSQRWLGRVGVPTPAIAARQMSFAESQRDILSQVAQSQNPAVQGSASKILKALQTPGIAGAVEWFKQTSTNQELREALEKDK